jgi:arylsulfatase A-like enzyme
MRWPRKIPANTTCDELAATIDILPTMARLIDAELPTHPIDGRDIRPLMFDEPGAESPREVYYHYYAGGELQAVRDRRWKLHFPHSYRTLAGRAGGDRGQPVPYSQAKIDHALFDLKLDVAETTDVAADHPEIVDRLRRLADEARRDLGDKLTDQVGTGIRPAGRLGPDDPRLIW